MTTRTAILWLQYLNKVTILHYRLPYSDLKAERMGICVNDIQTVHDMLPYLPHLVTNDMQRLHTDKCKIINDSSSSRNSSRCPSELHGIRIRIRNVFIRSLQKVYTKYNETILDQATPIKTSLVANIRAAYYIINIFRSYNKLKIHNKVIHDHARMSL